MTNWIEAIQLCQDGGKRFVLVTLLDTAGSTPRAAGTKMLITEDGIFDTVGGGHLEWDITKQARELLLSDKNTQKIEHYPLSSKLGQCCGGATIVLFEVFVEHVQRIQIFGAGHVAKALVPILAQLPLQITWVDQREDMFESIPIPNNVRVEVTETPVDLIKQIDEDNWVVILTHNHQLDFELVQSALAQPKVKFLGMIGSDTKARRFKQRLQHRDYLPEQIERLVSPIGLATVPGKRPIEVAVSISAQIIQLLEQRSATMPEPDNKQQWQTTKRLLELQ